MKATEQVDVCKFSMVFDPPMLDAAWRRHKRRRETTKHLKWLTQGMAIMLAIVIFSYWLGPK